MWEGVIGLLAGLVVGASIAVLLMKRRAGSTESVASLKRENEAFRDQVNEHFVQTAELINRLTDSYKAVFDHLSEGADKLVEPEVVRERMPQVSNEEVRLKRIGSVTPSSPPEQAPPADEASQAEKPDSDEVPEEKTPAHAETSEVETSEPESASSGEADGAEHRQTEEDREKPRSSPPS